MQDDCTLYSKRSFLRVFGVPLPSKGNETESDYRDIAGKKFSEMNVSIPEGRIDRSITLVECIKELMVLWSRQSF